MGCKHKGRQNTILWKKIARAFKDIYKQKKKAVNKIISTSIDKTININAGTTDCESTPNPEGQGEDLPATDRESCSRGHDGLVSNPCCCGH